MTTPEATWTEDPAATAALFGGDAPGADGDADGQTAPRDARQKHLFERQDRWLAAWVSSADKRLACQAADASLRTVQRWLQHDLHGFVARHDVAHLTLCAEIEAKIAYLWRGLKPGQNAIVLLAAANAEMPDKYRPNQTVSDDTASKLLDTIAELAKGGRRKRKPPKDAEAAFLESIKPGK